MSEVSRAAEAEHPGEFRVESPAELKYKVLVLNGTLAKYNVAVAPLFMAHRGMCSEWHICLLSHRPVQRGAVKGAGRGICIACCNACLEYR
jgi:hypothetical protein